MNINFIPRQRVSCLTPFSAWQGEQQEADFSTSLHLLVFVDVTRQRLWHSVDADQLRQHEKIGEPVQRADSGDPIRPCTPP